MFERFTTRARRAVVLAQEEARKLNHNFIGSEHVLLGVLRMIDGPVETLLSRLGITADAVQPMVVAIVGSGKSQSPEHIPFTPGGKQALTSALHFALRLGDNDIGAEHILLGLLDLPDTVDRVALRVLTTLGVDVAALRHQVTETIAASPRPTDSTEETQTGCVFICYRREDSAWVAGRLYDELARQLGSKRVFMDVDSVEPGSDYVAAIRSAISRSDLILVLIGRRWLDATGDNGQRRLDQPADPIRLEIETALSLGKRVIPALIDRADMPTSGQLPESISELSRRNGIRLEHEDFADRVRGIVKLIGPVR